MMPTSENSEKEHANICAAIRDAQGNMPSTVWQ